MDEWEIRSAVKRVEQIVLNETGAQLGSTAQEALTRLFRDVVSHNFTGSSGFSNRSITILLADIRGFTAISASQPSGTVLKVLNRCLIEMSEIVTQHRGRIDKFMGDSIMAIFEDAETAEEAARRALRCAVDMQIAMEALNAYFHDLHLPELYLGIGVNTGTVVAGVFGSSMFSTYTVIGDDVNLTSRIESFSLRGQVLIGQSTFELCGDYVETGPPIAVHVKGKENPVTLREVLSIPSLDKTVPRKELRRSPRVVVRIPFSFCHIEDDIELPETYHGTIVDIGYQGVLVETEWELVPSTDVKLNLELPLLGSSASNVYAKVVKTAKARSAFASGLEFTSLSPQDSSNIQRFVQLLIQGGETR